MGLSSIGFHTLLHPTRHVWKDIQNHHMLYFPNTPSCPTQCRASIRQPRDRDQGAGSLVGGQGDAYYLNRKVNVLAHHSYLAFSNKHWPQFHIFSFFHLTARGLAGSDRSSWCTADLLSPQRMEA